MKKTLLLLLLMSLAACTESNSNTKQHKQVEKLQMSIDSLKNILNRHTTISKNQIATFLTFQDNNAERAMNFYVGLFDNAKIIEIKRWGKNGAAEEGKIMHATFDLNGKRFMCSDSPPIHDWDFSPAVSNFIECDNERELERLFSKLSEKGSVTMPLNDYGFSKKFGWVIDQFGISWQLNLK